MFTLREVVGPGVINYSRETLLPIDPRVGLVEAVRLIQREDLVTIFQWTADPETRRHLDPAPNLPRDWSDQEQVQQAAKELWDYYQNHGEPAKITPLAAIDLQRQLLGVATIRWRGDPFVPKGRGIASIERLIVSPECRRKKVGLTLAVTAIEHAFYGFKGYNGRGANEVRAWIMTDSQAGDWLPNWNFFRGLGFQTFASAHWREYAAQRNIETDRDALWLRLERITWEGVKQKQPDLQSMIKSIVIT